MGLRRGVGDSKTSMTVQDHVNAAEHWIRQADNFAFPNAARTECLHLAPVHATLAQALAIAGQKPETDTL